jgi:acetyl-CoA synthetase
MSDLSLKEKLGARLHVAPPRSLAAGALFPDERSWSEFLAATARDPDPFFRGLAGSIPWRAEPTSLGDAGGWFPGGSLNLAEICLGAGGAGAPCLVWPADDGSFRTSTRAELESRVTELMGRLGTLGLRSGDRVAVLSAGGPDLAVSLLACFGSGIVAVPVSGSVPPDAATSRFRSIGCRAALVAAGIDASSLPTPHLEVRIDGAVPTAAAPKLAAFPPMHPALVFADAAGQPFTLPTAGFAVQAISAYRYILDGRPEACTWLLAPASHVATAAALVGALASGGIVGLAPVKEPAAELGGLLARLPGRTALVDTAAAHALGSAVERGAAGGTARSGSLEIVAVEGTSLDPRLLQLLHERLFDQKVHIVQALARPECGGFIAGPYPPVTRIRFSSVSRPAPGLSLEIVDSSGTPSPIGVGGMLALSRIPPCVALELQNAAPPAVIEAKARCDHDGNLWPLGEAHIALSDSTHVNVAELEAALAETPGVEQVAVVRYTDADGRQASRAFIKTEAGVEIAPDVLRAALASKLGPAVVPSSFCVVDELPYTRSGKLLRSVLRRVCEGEPLSDEELALIEDPAAAAALARQIR